ncbi:hypothetical protein BHOIPH791_10660 [Bartonella henselae]|uniref:Uncharacterized protein n=1 Tax=Bartonella henselae TaxID=38323 RepID=X5LY38_BARHN|nr:hypothetical protein [Bartonella henselae]ATP11674.1 hypothetical protein BhenCHDE101_00090 [Bartonella henselae]ETS09314.1 hypothetical protein Q654_00712 [Bartonella henselae JK 50]ETS09471.1 hypothetical protein Q655_00660 [Bartonella henselae JK 51]MDM9996661.1 hypothetical protein [Bartonella henselae]OLL37917.1 hypothetical protein AT237_02880 [Bartonella henselae]
MTIIDQIAETLEMLLRTSNKKVWFWKQEEDECLLVGLRNKIFYGDCVEQVVAEKLLNLCQIFL